MPVPPTGHSSSIDSASSFSSSKSSLLPPALDVSSQSDIADPKPSSMPRADTYAYGVAASPSQATSRPTNGAASAVSATQKFKRAFGKRRRPSQDAGTLLSSGDEQSASDFGSSSSSSHLPSSLGVAHSSSARPSAAKLTMHLFGGRKTNQTPLADPNQPPPLPPKPSGLRAPVPPTLQMPISIVNKLSAHTHGSRPRSSVMATSPSITAAIEFMREDEERQRAAGQRRETTPVQNGDLEQNKEDWRKSDSTMDSGHTVRPAHPPDAGPGAASKRLSTFLATPPRTDLGLGFLGGMPVSPGEAEGSRQETRAVDATAVNVGKQSKRRSLSLNIHVPSTPEHAPAPPSAPVPAYTPLYLSPLSTPNPGSMRSSNSPVPSVSLTPSPRDTPTLTRTPANGIIGSGTASGAPVSKTNIRGRLAAWTATTGVGQRSTSPLAAASTSSPSLTSPSDSSLHPTTHRRGPVMSDASQPSPDLQAVAAVRQLQNRTRSPSGASISSTTGIRQAATSLTSGAGAMALGLGKRAYEKVGRVWGGSGSGSSSGSGSDTPSNHYQPAANASGVSRSNTPQPSANLSHGPSAFPPLPRRTPNAPSGTWSISSLGASRSSSEKDPAAGGRETPSSGNGAPSGMGKLVRLPRGSAGGVVFGRELWECVRETRATAAGAGGDPLAGRMIPALVLRCTQHLHKWGIEEEGLFRISGRSSHINRLRNEFDSGADYDITDCSPSELDPHAVASVFKAYLRELPEPILTRALGPLFDAAMSAESSRAPPATPTGILPKTIGGSGPSLPSGPRALPMIRKPPSLSTFTLPTSSSLRAPSASLIETLGDLVSRLPRENRDLLLTVVELMQATAARSKETKMPLSNLLLVFCPSLSMGPTLLRVLCDAQGVWERPPPVMDISRPQDEGEDEDSDESDSDSDSASEDEQVVTLPPRYKGKEREIPIEDSQFAVPSSASPHPEEVEEPEPEDSPTSLPLARPRAIRRVPVPALLLENQHLEGSSPFGDRSFSPPLLTDPLPRSESTPSLEVPSRSLTPSSPPQSAISLTSAPEVDTGAIAPSLGARQFSSPLPSSGFIPPSSWAVPDHDKALPAFPRSPTQVTAEDRASSTPQLSREAHPVRTSSLPATQLLASHSAPSVVFPSAKTAPTTPTSPKKHALTLSIGRSAKLPNDEDVPSPTKRLTRRPSLNMLFNIKRGVSPSPRSRTPTISSPISSPTSNGRPMSSVESSPKTVTNFFPPVLSLPIEGSMDVSLGWDDVFGGSGEPALAPPAPPQPRPTTASQSSTPSPWSQSPPSPSRRPTTEYLTSSGGFFSSNGPPLMMPSAIAVLEAANTGADASPSSERALSSPGGITSSPEVVPSSPKVDPASPEGAPPPPEDAPPSPEGAPASPEVTASPPDVAPSSPADSPSSSGVALASPDGAPPSPGATSPSPSGSSSVPFQEDSSSGDDSPAVYSPGKEVFTPPPHLSFQLRRSSLEDEDWASAVLLAAGKPAESVA